MHSEDWHPNTVEKIYIIQIISSDIPVEKKNAMNKRVQILSWPWIENGAFITAKHLNHQKVSYAWYYKLQILWLWNFQTAIWKVQDSHLQFSLNY